MNTPSMKIEEIYYAPDYEFDYDYALVQLKRDKNCMKKRITIFSLTIGLGLAVCAETTVIDHTHLAGVTNASMTLMNKVGALRWFYTHASVGGNMVTGMNELRQSNTNRYLLALYNYDGNNGDSDYHGAIATTGRESFPDYSAAPPPATANGMIYECMRGNPRWDNKITCFSNSVAGAGWRFPSVNVVMDKFCWIDPAADPATYCSVLSDLENAFRETLFVYMTMPLTTETEGSDNDSRNTFNRYVRAYCNTHNKWLLDVADVEAWSTNGVEQTYLSSGTTNQMMVDTYAVDAGGDFHLTVRGRRQTALAWYALAIALFQSDRDADGITDGDELIAGTCPTDASSCFTVSNLTASASNLVFDWPSASNRYYRVQMSSNLLDSAAWTNISQTITSTPPRNSYTAAVDNAKTRYYRLNANQ